MSPHVLGDGRLTHRDAQLLKLPVNPRRTPERIRGGQLANQGANVGWHARAAGALSALPRPEQTKPAAVPRDDGLRLDDVNGRAPAAPCLREPRPQHPVGRREAKTGRRDRFTTASWCRSAMISRCSEARDRTMNRSEWSRETTTDDTTAGYRRRPVTSIETAARDVHYGLRQLRRNPGFPAVARRSPRRKLW